MDVIEMEGRKFGRWTVLGKAGRNKQGKFIWHCQCDCGTKRVVMGR